MTNVEIEPTFVSVCSELHLVDQDQTEAVLQDIGVVGEESLFPNHRIEIDKGDIQQSEIEFSSGKLSTPQHHESDYIVADFHDGLEPNQIHVHSYIHIDEFDKISGFYNEVGSRSDDLIDEVEVSSIEIDMNSEVTISQMGFTYEGSSELSLDGTRFTYDSIEFSTYSVEDESTIRGLIREPGSIDTDEYGAFVNEKLEQMQSGIEEVSQ